MPRYKAYVVPETHWDRDWYLTFEEFRTRLVRTMDKLLDILPDPKFKAFTFDGQTVVLEDYLQIRPEREAEIKKWVRRRKLFVGPWYVLADNYLVSGESLVRNLILGRRTAAAFGHVMNAGYVPDPFGHPSQLPQILRGFGLDSFIFMRGTGAPGTDDSCEFRWVAPDGASWVYAICQVGGYVNFGRWGVPTGRPTDTQEVDEELALKQVSELLDKYEKCNPNTRHLLFNNGSDHFPAQPAVPRLIRSVNARQKRAELVQASFEDYVNAFRAARPKLRDYTGELHEGKYHPLLSGVYSSRVYLKQANELAQRTLERYAEPAGALAHVEGAPYEDAFLWHAWRQLLKNHPHDDICGCSIDAVHRDMLPRFEHATQVGELVACESLLHLARLVKRDGRPALVVFNMAGATRDCLVRGEALLRPEEFAGEIRLVDSSGKNVPCVVKRLKVSKVYDDAGDIYDNDGEPRFPSRRRLRVSYEALVSDVPGLGYTTLYFIPGKSGGKGVRVGASTLENEFIRVRARANGAFDVTDKRTGKTYKGCNLLVDEDDAGDEYDHSFIKRSKTVTSARCKARVRKGRDDGFQGSLVASYSFPVPESLTEDRQERAARTVGLRVTVEVSLTAASTRVEFRTTVENRAKDHRLRALFPTNVRAQHVLAASKFDLVERSLKIPNGRGWVQKPVPTHHNDGLVAAADGKRGLALLNKGLPEYEARRGDGGRVELLLTLLRCVGWLSRGDVSSRPNNAGPGLPTPEAQCQGMHEFEYALYPFEGSVDRAQLAREAEAYAVGARGVQPDGRRRARLPEECAFLTVEPGALVVTAVKKCEERDSVILRFYNSGTRKVRGRVQAYRKIRAAYLCNLAEERQESLQPQSDGKALALSVPGKQIITLELSLGGL